VAKFLSAEWLDLVRAATPAIGTRIDCTISGAPDVDVKVHIDDGDVGLGLLDDADVSLTLPYPEALQIARGELQPSVAFMQGRMKTAGDPGRLLAVLAATATPDFQDRLERVASATEF
jgi:putative sterol carrier protein